VKDFELNHEHEIKFCDIPIAWTTRFEFFTPDLEQFPLIYVHRKVSSSERVFGFPLNCSIIRENDIGLCDIIVKFLCNLPQGNPMIDNLITEELSHRFGLANKVNFEDLKLICKNSPQNLPLLQSIWNEKISHVYGNSIPHGKLFDEVYGIIRFSASGNAPRLGKTSELRMLYWYMKGIGQAVSFGPELDKFGFCEFYILPTKEETRGLEFAEFPNFARYYEAINALWELEYTATFDIQNYSFRFANNTGSLPNKASDFESRYERLLPDYYNEISWLRQIFNRMPGRLYGYIWNMMTFIETGYMESFSDRETFKTFVKHHHGKKGSSSKVLACILQQCFGLEALPIDTWVKTFIYYPLALNPTNNGKSNTPSPSDIDKLYNSFDKLDKLEKLIWVSSMGNKTNKTEFEDILWCQRYGTDQGQKGPCRGSNPLSCLQCSIREFCGGFQSISLEKVVISNNVGFLQEEMISRKSLFGIHTHNNTPRQVFILENNVPTLRDAHTGFSISTDTKISESTYVVMDFIAQILETAD
jgi:hypothetical protein